MSDPRPTAGARSLVLVVFDSCRFDTFVEARPRAIRRLGEIERRHSYASWTAPSHYNLLMGLMPHPSPRHVHASELYKREYRRYRERLGIDDVEFRQLLPGIWLPEFLRRRHGYRTEARVSLPVLNEHTPLAVGFDHYELMARHNDMAAMVDALRFEPGRPAFHLLNVGETHYPYALPDEPEDAWPRLHGVHGAIGTLDDAPREGRHGPVGGDRSDGPSPFDARWLAALRQRQVEAVRYLDGVVERLYDVVPRGSWIVITSDHGELFGEDGYFGHGPIQHPKVLEVPFVEGRLV